MTDRRTIVFFPEGAFGPTNNCVGIGNVLRARGHRVVFIVEESFAGRLAAQGFEERLMRLGPPPEVPEVPGQFWIDFIRDTAPVFRKPTIEQLGEFIAPTWTALCDGARYVEMRLPAILDEVRPTHGELWSGFDAFMREQGAPGLTNGPLGPEFIHESPFLNLVLYPEEADYVRETPLGPTWHRLGSCVRSTLDAWHLPTALGAGAGGRDGALLYLSLGSLGSADVELMQRLVDILGRTHHRVIVSKGPLAEQLHLPENMAGEAFLPQPAIIPQVDLVITHGGNNTVTEAFHHGKPMVVLPLFWDQVDNAQRVAEAGFGARLPAYTVEPDELTGAVARLLADTALKARLRSLSGQLQASPGTVRAADLVERLARTGEPITD